MHLMHLNSSITAPPAVLPGNVYTDGGTVQAGRGVYLARQADRELLDLCMNSTFAYVLSSRQVGKSSLMIETAKRLKEQQIQTVIIDLTAIGTQLSAEQWYLGLLVEIQQQLELKTDVVDWWIDSAYLGPVQRLMRFFQQVVLVESDRQTVIFVDEIDTTLRMEFTDDFFAAIRAVYNGRATDERLKRLSFVLLGVATPGDLIHDPTRTPFNIGQRVDLTDFTPDEALPLTSPLNINEKEQQLVLKWVLYWTGGHPYLTQHLLRVLAEQPTRKWTEAEVASVVQATFFDRGCEGSNHLQFVRDMLTKRAPDKEQVLITYQNVLLKSINVPDEEQSPIKSHLKLSGVVVVAKGLLHVRNRIYSTIFDNKWIVSNLPKSLGENIKAVQDTEKELVVYRERAIFATVIAIGIVSYNVIKINLFKLKMNNYDTVIVILCVILCVVFSFRYVLKLRLKRLLEEIVLYASKLLNLRQ